MEELIGVLVVAVQLGVWFLIVRTILAQAGKRKKDQRPAPAAAERKRGAPERQRKTERPAARREPEQMQMSFEGEDPCHDHMDRSEPYLGSLKATTLEGEDPGHDHSLHRAPRSEKPQKPDVPAPSVLPDFTDRGELARAFVLSEILMRPSDRRRR